MSCELYKDFVLYATLTESNIRMLTKVMIFSPVSTDVRQHEQNSISLRL